MIIFGIAIMLISLLGIYGSMNHKFYALFAFGAFNIIVLGLFIAAGIVAEISGQKYGSEIQDPNQCPTVPAAANLDN